MLGTLSCLTLPCLPGKGGIEIGIETSTLPPPGIKARMAFPLIRCWCELLPVCSGHFLQLLRNGVGCGHFVGIPLDRHGL